MDALLARWDAILNPPHKIKLTEHLTDSLQTTGNITDMSDLIMGNYVPMGYDPIHYPEPIRPIATLIPSEQVTVMEPPPPLRYLNQPPEHIRFTITADTWQDHLNQIEQTINNTISKIGGGA